MQHYTEIRELIDRVRARWRALSVLHAVMRGALFAAAVVGAAVIASRWTAGAPLLLVMLAAGASTIAVAALAICLWPLRRAPQDAKVARFIEERAPSLDDRLVSAVDVAQGKSAAPALASAMIADAARRSSSIDVDTIVSSRSLRRAAGQAAAAAIVLGSALFIARGPARQAVDAASLTLFPARTTLEVRPGNTRLKAGAPLGIEARLVGSRAPVIAQLQIADGDQWRSTDMTLDRGLFHASMPAVLSGFKYRVVAGTVMSPIYDVSVAHPPRVTRIDVDYAYPEGLRLQPRTETDAGDIYAPSGTSVRVHVFTDRPAANGVLALAGGNHLALTTAASTELTASLNVVNDTSYRVALADKEGFGSPGDTEYFIRVLEDRPPEVRILKPAADRPVTRLEEVDVEAQAEDDYGIDRLDLVYSVRGGPEQAVPLPIDRGKATVNGRHTLALEELDVQPGDFVSYYVRARDLTRGTRPSEARSDIFFLEVKPYEQEFALAQSQGGMPGGGGQNGIDDLVNAQKEIVVATWKLDRRAQASKGAKSEQDVHSVARAEAELKTRVEQTASTFRESTMRDPRKRQPQRGRGGAPPPPAPPGTPELKAGETLPEEDHMTAAATAMGRAVTSLDGLKTTDALPPELEALNRLLKAQADVKKREVTRQQAGAGAGNNRSNYDMSALFDKELQKAQQTNYETKSSTEQREDQNQSALDKIRDLARRQDELLKKQHELAEKRAQLSEEELKRQLEQLTREQMELRQKAEELAQQLQAKNGQEGRDGKKGQDGQEGKKGQDGQEGKQGQDGQEGKQGQQGQAGQAGQTGQSGNDASQRLRDVTEEMRSAASELRRQDPGQASARGNKALEKLRQLQQQLESARPDDRRRALGDMQLEARQLADAQRQIAGELAKAGQGDAGKDTVRRLSGEEERLAERARKLQQSLKQSAAGGQQPGAPRESPGANRQANGAATDARVSAAAADAGKEIERQKLAERMDQAAEAMRAATDEPKGGGRGNTASRVSDDARSQVGTQQELARALDKVAERLAAATGAHDGESQKLSDQKARAQELRDRLDRAANDLAKAGQTGQAGRAGQAGQAGQAGRAGQAGQTGRAGQAGRNGEQSGSSSQSASADSGQPGQGQSGGGGAGTDLEKLRDEYRRQLQETKDFMDQLRRDDPNFSRGGGGGFTFEAPDRMTLSAPGTEAFKQDFAKWEELRRQATQALENVTASLSKKLQAKQAKDRLAAGTDDKPPAAYQQQVDNYFKAIASKKKP